MVEYHIDTSKACSGTIGKYKITYYFNNSKQSATLKISVKHYVIMNLLVLVGDQTYEDEYYRIHGLTIERVNKIVEFIGFKLI